MSHCLEAGVVISASSWKDVVFVLNLTTLTVMHTHMVAINTVSKITLILNWPTQCLNRGQTLALSLSLSLHTHTLLVLLQISSCNVFFLQLPVSPQLGKSLRHYDRIGCLCWWRPAWFWHVVMQGKGVGVRGWMCEGVKKEGLAKDGWLDNWSARSEEIKVPRSGLDFETSCFFRRWGQLDDLIFRWLADDVFVFLGWRDACELGVDLIILRNLEHFGAILDHPCQQVRSPWDLKDVFDVRQVILGQLVILLQVAEPLFGGGDVVALVLRDVLLAGRFELLQVLVGDVFRQVAEQRAVLRHGPEEQKWVSYRQGERHRDGSDAWVCGTISSKTLKLVESNLTEATDVVRGGRKKVHLVSPARFTFVVLSRSVMNLSAIHQRGKTRPRCLG